MKRKHKLWIPRGKCAIEQCGAPGYGLLTIDVVWPGTIINVPPTQAQIIACRGHFESTSELGLNEVVYHMAGGIKRRGT